MKKYVCSVCGHVHNSDSIPNKCVVCFSPSSKLQLQDAEPAFTSTSTRKLTVEVKSADYYDVIELLIDGRSYGTLEHNKRYTFDVSNSNHIIGALYTNREPDYADYRHSISPVNFSGNASFVIEIINIFRGGVIKRA